MIELPDVNVLVALLWEAHLHHAAAVRWFSTRHADGWATCSITQTGFVRVSSNPAVLRDAVTPAEATAVLAATIARPGHRFLADTEGYVGNARVPHGQVVGHRQVTDAALVGLVRWHDARVVTFDRALGALAADAVRVLDATDPSATG